MECTMRTRCLERKSHPLRRVHGLGAPIMARLPAQHPASRLRQPNGKVRSQLSTGASLTEKEEKVAGKLCERSIRYLTVSLWASEMA